VTWIGLLLLALGATDLTNSLRPVRLLPGAVGAAVAVGAGLAAGLTSGVDLAAVLVIAVLALVWDWSVTRGLGRGPAWVPLVLLAIALAAAVALSGQAGPGGGLLGRWLDDVAVPVLAQLEPDRALLLAGVLVAQLSTGNVLVRLVLAVTNTVNPARHGTPSDPEMQLKGGRLLGPMERLFIVCLGLAGQLTAASVVVAAKGLLRFPELQSRVDQDRIHQLTEYFLVGSFASWLIALSSLVLLAR
jgi:hypothetical protein